MALYKGFNLDAREGRILTQRQGDPRRPYQHRFNLDAREGRILTGGRIFDFTGNG